LLRKLIEYTNTKSYYPLILGYYGNNPILLFKMLQQREQGKTWPPGFSHMIQQNQCLYNIKHWFCENIPTLANHQSQGR